MLWITLYTHDQKSTLQFCKTQLQKSRHTIVRASGINNPFVKGRLLGGSPKSQFTAYNGHGDHSKGTLYLLAGSTCYVSGSTYVLG